MRICFATPEYPPHLGGSARSARRLVQGLARAGHDVSVFASVTGDQQRATLPGTDGAVPIHWLPADLEAATCGISAADAIGPFDLFHGFTLIAAYPCFESAATGHRPVVASIRGADGLSFDDVATAILRQVAWITSVSSDSLARANAVVDVSRRSSVIPNGIDVDSFAPWQPSAENLGVVGTVATFRVKKNIPLLVHAYARLSPRLRRGLLLVGDAVEGNTLKASLRHTIELAIDQERLRAEVEITGILDHAQVASAHQRMRVFALSSDHEGMPNALLEAAASGVPIVTTAVDGVKDMLTDGTDALLVPLQDETALADALTRVLSDETLAVRLSQRARATAARLSWEAELRAYLDLYESLVAGHAAVR